jgi:hypothetical protein
MLSSARRERKKVLFNIAADIHSAPIHRFAPWSARARAAFDLHRADLKIVAQKSCSAFSEHMLVDNDKYYRSVTCELRESRCPPLSGMDSDFPAGKLVRRANEQRTEPLCTRDTT